METQQPSVKDNLHHRVRTKYKLVDTENSMTTNNEETEDIDFASTSDTCLLLPGKLAQTPASVAVCHNENENVWVTSIQLFIPFLLAGFGMVAASLLLDVVQHWPVYQKIPEVYILVPALLGLKGNLEMTLASRLSTQANLGYMDNRKQQWSMVVGNLALIQCQAIVVGFLASLAAVIMGWVPDGEFAIEHALLLCASSVVTSSAASFVLGLIMILVILLSRHFHINPDNVATPIAASLGDLTTLALLSWFASVLYIEIGTHIYIFGPYHTAFAQVPVLAGKASWMSAFISVAGLMVIPLWAWMASKNPHTQKVLTNGWTPVIFAMLISSVGGLILDFTVSKYKGVAVFQLVINGVGGNLVAVQASRISTDMHSKAIPGQLPSHMSLCVNPIKTFCDNGEHAKIAQVLLLMVVPGHLIFSYTISYLQAGHTSLTPVFMAVYLFVALLQVVLLLYIAHVMILWMWKVGVDPDNSAIPYLTAVGDLLGTLLLGVAFQFLYVIGDRDSDVGD